MEITVRAGTQRKRGSSAGPDEAIVLFATKGQDIRGAVGTAGAGFVKPYGALRRRQVFDGGAREVQVLHGTGSQGAPLLVLAGLGTVREGTGESLRLAASSALRQAREAGARAATILLPEGRGAWMRPRAAAKAVTEGARIGLYRFETHKREKSKTRIDRITLVAPRGQSAAVEQGVRRGEAVAEAVCFARDLGNEPSNVATPTHLAQAARRIAAEEELGVEILEREDMERLGMGSFLGVAKGSAEPPKMIVLTYEPRGVRGRVDTVALVGKGLTFDSGGISIKPSAKMEDMKFDMCGGAAVLATMKAVRRLGVKVRVVGLVGSTENMPGGAAYKPGDVLTAMDGTTIEVRNTDAEGRLVLADVLSYATTRMRPKPRAVVDLATLTGACVVALGDQHAGLLGSNDALKEKLRAAAESSGDAVWPLPLTAGYRKQLDSPYADVSNLGTPGAGTITAAAFLERFTHDVPWAHLDIAGVAWTDKQGGYLTKGATGFGVRLLCQLLTSWK